VPDFGVRLHALQERVQVAARYSTAYTLKISDGRSESTWLPPAQCGGSSYTDVTGTIEQYDMKVPANSGRGLPWRYAPS